MTDAPRQRHEHDTEATVGDEDKSEVGRMAGTDAGYAGTTGAEERADAADDPA